jgi:capsular exopolysaccharide synthesis family protein
MMKMEEFRSRHPSDVPAKLPVASLEFEEMLERMQTPAARRARQAAFDASPLEMGQAAVAQAIKTATPQGLYPWLDEVIRFPSADGFSKTLLVTSTQPLEGKTAAAFRIAKELAKHSKVLMIDANMHSPRLHAVFGMENTFGLSSLLTKKVTAAGVSLVIKQTDDSNISLLPSGAPPENPTALFTSRHMRDLLQSVKRDHGYIIIDSSSVKSTLDAVHLSPLVDGVMVIQGKTTSTQDVLGTVKLFDRSELAIIQVVFNKS